MMILAKLSSDQWIGICAIGVAFLVGVAGNIIAYLQYRKGKRLLAARIVRRPLDIWKQTSLPIRISLHRLSAIATLLLVLILVWQTRAKFTKNILLGVLIFEFFWFFKHLKFNPIAKHRNKKESWAYIIPQYIENHVDLKYLGINYPCFLLLIELLALTYLCVISGGIESPFFSLYAMFCVLALYVSYSIHPIRSLMYIISLCFCFLLILYLGDHEFSLRGVEYEILEPYRMKIEPSSSYLFPTMYAWSIAVCGLLFLGITSYFSQIGKEQLNAPVEQTKNILAAQEFPIKPIKKGLPVFIIGTNLKINPNKTLALLPYCARGLRCPIRKENENQPPDVPINGKQCHQCDELCAIGKMSYCQDVAEIKVIGSHHRVKEAIADFLTNHNGLTHVIAVCCTSRLAKYLPETKDDKYKNITVVYTPLLTGMDKCLSSTYISHDGRGGSPLPCTSFNADALVEALKSMPKV